MEYYVRMSFRQWLAMFALFVMYVFLGASIFYTIEHNLETERRAVELQERVDINELLTTYTSPDDQETQNKILAQVSDYCGRKVTNHTLDEYVEPYNWNFIHAIYFSFTTCTTVGYGNISPSTSLGRTILCFYALFGIPLSCFFIASVSHFFAATYLRLYRQYTEYQHANTKNYVPPAVGFAGKIFLYLTPGLVVFIFLPAIFFSYFEDWDYVRSVYFSFVTLSTVGYGDLVPTFQAHQEREFHLYFIVYQIFIIFWNIAGLGYVLMIINFIAKAMKSKRIAELEHKISQNIRATEQMVRHEVSKDLNLMRRLLNEVNFLKVKPVYTDVASKRQSYSLARFSSSCPDLSMYDARTPARHGRSYSLAIDCNLRKALTTPLRKANSDSDLNYIDRQKTFANSSNSFGKDDLITKVVSALGTIQKQDRDERTCSELGLFSDSDILENSRRCSGWSLNRCDAGFGSLSRTNQLTWNGRNSNEVRPSILVDRDAVTSSRPPAFTRSVSLHIPEDDDDSRINMNREISNRMIKRTNSPKTLVFDEGQRHSVVFPEMESQMNWERKKGKRSSIISLPREYVAATSRGRDSIVSILDTPVNATNLDLLEKTSVADLIRALEVVHSTSAKDDGTASPKRKNRLTQIMNSRRGSLRPLPSYTTIFTSSNTKNPIRKISSQSTPDSSMFSRQSSLRPHGLPPPYTPGTVQNPAVNRFSVRSIPSIPSPERMNQSMPPTALLQKKLPHGPSPLARNT